MTFLPSKSSGKMREKISAYTERRKKEAFQLLKQLVLQQSYSRNKSGVDAVGAMIAASLRESGMQLEVIPELEVGDQLVFRSPACKAGKPSILLLGHMDTVFPPDTTFNWYREDVDKVFGPGVIDMKGGLVVAIFALNALASLGLLEKIPIVLICNSDEEIGSPASTSLIKRLAAESLLAMVFECGGLAGELVTGRKGRDGYTLKVAGRAGHAAFAGPDKASAILELAHKTIALENLNDQQKKIVLNVGVIRGGIGPNTVADSARAEIDIRFLLTADGDDVAARVKEITENSTIPGTHAELQRTATRAPMEQTVRNRELFQLICREAEKSGLPCREELRSGVSDANTIGLAGIPVIDGMGPIGDCDHSEREYMVKKSLLERTKLAAHSIVRAWEYYGS